MYTGSGVPGDMAARAPLTLNGNTLTISFDGGRVAHLTVGNREATTLRQASDERLTARGRAVVGESITEAELDELLTVETKPVEAPSLWERLANATKDGSS
jgi:hypothetical protein